ncbi:GreA/GreB family elongation factor [Tenacibaculum piscium]|uniref:3-oxoacyl-ACP synthase n=1 Tax=Tenacibaculum piscium TaxID=1458515 RepID=A0A2H1YKA0_9FLAO|nr:GreA/GreB family elongation factor [Tenacibaculum piscium]MBE7629273.1 3-oxoacyl-ACP synthase [Tenacibaculum piscium]SOS75936.1 3-oxoacyl-ACP synthase [Tenacibaculum piscium]
MSIKEKLYEQCVIFVANRLKTVEEIISSNQKALQSETKSSAGDKHETGRAMLQLEMEKAGQQLHGIIKMKEILSKINTQNSQENSKIAHLGSLVKTTKNSFYLSISSGQLIIDNQPYFAVSVSSPIGRILLGKKQGDSFVFDTMEQKIVEIL